MKSFVQWFSLGLLAFSASASPLVEDRASATYALTISSLGNNALNGQTLEIVNSVLGVYPGTQTAAKVYAVANPTQTGRVSLHTLPIGIVDHVLGLQGNNGLYSLIDSVNVGQTANTLFYDQFILKNGLVEHRLPGRWVAFPANGGYVVRRYDGTAIVTQDYVPVNIVYKAINQY